MTVRQFVQLVRRWRSVILATALIGIVVGWLSAPGTAGTPTTFEATHTLLLDPRARGSAEINRAAVRVRRGAVPDRVAARLGLDPRSVRSVVSSTTRDNLGEVLITGRSTDRAQAEALADTTAEELIVELGGPASPLRTLERAVASPVENPDVQGPRSRPGRALLLGAFGVLLGAGAAFGLEQFDRRIRSSRAAEAALGAPVLAEIPAVAAPDGNRPLRGLEAPALLEPYRRIGTFLGGSDRQGGVGGGVRVLVVTSANAGDGKTTTVAHLATALGELGRSVLAVSADLRRPRLHSYFGRGGEPGLVEVLGADVALEDLDLATAVRGVRLVASGPPVENPAPLLERVGDVLRAARNLSDLVLVDAPPLLGVTDAAELARHADGVLLVVRAGRTSTAAARRSAELLRRLDIPIIGAVLVGAER